MNSRYVYPAIFTHEESGYSIRFPDIPGCYSCSETLEDSLLMAEDALALMLYEYEHDNQQVPVASDISSIILKNNEFVNYVACDTLEYRKKFNSKAIKKTLTIPQWLNEEACAMKINFSQVLQEALLEKLNIL